MVGYIYAVLSVALSFLSAILLLRFNKDPL